MSGRKSELLGILVLMLTLGSLYADAKLTKAPRRNKQPKSKTRIPLSRAINHLGLEVLKNLAAGEGGNVLISPISLAIPLNMLILGADEQDELKSTIEQALGYKEIMGDENRDIPSELSNLLSELKAEKKSNLVISNMLAHNTDLIKVKSGYVSLINKNFDTDVTSFSRRAKKPIDTFVNNWIASETNGVIKEIVDQTQLDNENNAIVFLNAVYFKGLWKKAFRDRVADGSFTNAQGETSSVLLMLVSGQYRWKEFTRDRIKFDALSIPYQDGEFDFIIILPKRYADIENLQNSFTSANLERVFEDLNKTRPIDIYLKLPKFKLESMPPVQSSLKEMGLSALFEDSDRKLSLISDDPLKIDDILHKVRIDVSQTETEASAGNQEASSRSASGKGRKREFSVVHPFLFVVRDTRSNSVLFLGRVNELTSNESVD